MPASFEALAAIVLFVLPGGLFHWTYERTVGGAWTFGLDDRVLRFVRSSAVLHVLLLPLTWRLVRHYQRLAIADPVDYTLWLGTVGFLLIPGLIGGAAAVAHRRGWTRRLPVVGALDAPRAWDHVFGGHPAGLVRIRLRSQAWIAGLLGVDEQAGTRSFVSAFPRERDMYLVRRVDVDAENGEWNADDDGNLVLLESGILIGWDQVDLIEFFPDGEEGRNGQ